MRPIRKILISFIQYYFSLHLSVLIAIHNVLKKSPKRFIFFDIDNTIADSWPSFLVNDWKSTNDRLRKLAVFIGVRNWICVLQAYRQNQIFYISARPYNSWFCTIDWLRSVGVKASITNVIITNSAEEKITLLKRISDSGKMVYWIDDLSYNHERGQVLFYHNVLNEVKNTDIKFFGEPYIVKVNNP